MYTIYKQIVLKEDSASRSLNDRVTRTLGVGQHSVRIHHISIKDNTMNVGMVNQFDEYHTEPIPILDGEDRISWSLWRLLLVLMQDRSETFRARSLVVADTSILEQLKGMSVTVHVTHGEGYSVVRGANNRYWLELMPRKIRLLQETFNSHGEAQRAGEMAGHPPSKFIIGKWESGSAADTKPFRFRRTT
jgi:hypothetical protein